jgi:hypothetical protein
VDVGLPVVAVLVLVFDVVVIVQDMGMRMGHIPVGVLMGVLCGHLHCSVPAAVSTWPAPGEVPIVFEFVGLVWLILHASRGLLTMFPVAK